MILALRCGIGPCHPSSRTLSNSRGFNPGGNPRGFRPVPRLGPQVDGRRGQRGNRIPEPIFRRPSLAPIAGGDSFVL